MEGEAEKCDHALFVTESTQSGNIPSYCLECRLPMLAVFQNLKSRLLTLTAERDRLTQERSQETHIMIALMVWFGKVNMKPDPEWGDVSDQTKIEWASQAATLAKHRYWELQGINPGEEHHAGCSFCKDGGMSAFHKRDTALATPEGK